MSRLTYKDDNDYKLLRGRECQWKKKIKEEYETIDNSIQKLGKLEDIEEQLCFPLDIVFRALKDGIYVEDRAFNTFEKHNVRGIGLKSLSVISKICDYAECDFSCYYEDYKKTWWLKEDRSE